MNSLSRNTKLYLIFMYVTGIFLLFRALIGIKMTEPVLFAIFCVLGSVLHILKVEGATNCSHYTFSFLIFGFAILRLNSQLGLIVIVVSNLAEWIWNRPPRLIHLFMSVATWFPLNLQSSFMHSSTLWVLRHPGR